MTESRFEELLTKYFAQAATLSERRELYQLLREMPKGQERFELMDQLTALEVEFSPEPSINQIDENWELVRQRIHATATTESRGKVAGGRFRKIIRIISVAACLLVFIGLGYYWLHSVRGDNGSPNVLMTKKGSRSYIELSDGTKVWLNAASKLTYDKDFGDNTREVYLTGEAFFEVRKDTRRPFVVHTRNLDIRVLGTVFNLSAYDEDNATTATLLEGSIKAILNKEEGKELLLKPNEKLVVRNSKQVTETVSKKPESRPNIILTEAAYLPDSSAVDIQWTRDKLAFNNTRLEEIAHQLERWYGITVKVEGESLKDRRFSGVFETESLQQVVDALAITGNFNYQTNNNELIIYP